MARLAGSDVERRRRSDRRASARTRDAAVTLPARQAADVAAAAQLACLLEASAPKPGNVSPFASFRDATYEDFLASAAAIGPALLMAGEKVFVRRVAEGGEGGHVAGLGGTRLQQAGELGSGCHVRRLPRGESHRGVTRPSRCSTIAPATSLDVASCKPRHPGIPLTSTTYVVPSRAGRRSTPA